jgi:hypothetical protein
MVKTKNLRNMKLRKTSKCGGGKGYKGQPEKHPSLQDLLNALEKKSAYTADTQLAEIDLYIALKKLSEKEKEQINTVLNIFLGKIPGDNSKEIAVIEQIKQIISNIQAQSIIMQKVKETKPKSEVVKVDKAKSKADEAKAKMDEAKLKADEAKLKAEEAKAKVDEAKLKAEEAKAKAMEIKAKADEVAKNMIEESRRKRKTEKKHEKKQIKAANIISKTIRRYINKNKILQKQSEKQSEKTSEKTSENKSEKQSEKQLEKTSENKSEEQILPKQEKSNILLDQIRGLDTTNRLSQFISIDDINLLLEPNLVKNFNYITGNYLNYYTPILNIPQFLQIQHIETIILVIVGIINYKLKQKNAKIKIILKGGKGLQINLFKRKWENIQTDDIDLLIKQDDDLAYNPVLVETYADNLSQIINVIITGIYNEEKISILPKEKSRNPNIVKISYMLKPGFFAILDVDFKNDEHGFFASKNLEHTERFVKSEGGKIQLLYHHQTLDAFINEKNVVIGNYKGCDCNPPIGNPKCEPLCPDKERMLRKFQKYEPLITYYKDIQNSSSKR